MEGPGGWTDLRSLVQQPSVQMDGEKLKATVSHVPVFAITCTV